MGELAADHGADLGELLDRGQPVEPRHQRIVQVRRDRKRRQRARKLVVIASVGHQARFEHCPGQLLEEQGHAVGTLQDLIQDLGRQRLAAGDLKGHRSPLTPAEAVERQRRHVRLARPRRAELRPVGDHYEDRQATRSLDHHVEQLQSRGVGPVQVFIQLEHGPLAGEPGQLLDQDLEGALLLALRAKVQGAVAIISRDAQQRPDQRRRLVQLLGALSEQRLQLGESVRGFVMGGEARRPLQLRDDRVERAVGVVGRAEDG